MEKIREELICAVCLDILSEPKVLQCAHSFCCTCLETIVSHSRESVLPRENARTSDKLECPCCRSITLLPGGRVKHLPTNYNLRRLVDIVSDEDKQHTRETVRRRKWRRPTIDRNRRPRCGLHKKGLEYFCRDCNELLCRKCMMEAHRDHNYGDVEEVLPEQLAALKNLIQPAHEVSCAAMAAPAMHCSSLFIYGRDRPRDNGSVRGVGYG